MARAACLTVAFVLAVLMGSRPAISDNPSLHDAARSGDLPGLEALLAAGAPLQALDAHGDTPLIAAAYSGQTEAVVRLLDAGAPVDGRSDRGMTALHAAAYRGYPDIVSLLLDRGADVNDQENIFRITPLHAAAEENHLEVVKVMLAAGADPDRREVNAITPLTRSGWKGNWKVFETLRKAGAECQPVAVSGELLYERCMAIDP